MLSLISNVVVIIVCEQKRKKYRKILKVNFLARRRLYKNPTIQTDNDNRYRNCFPKIYFISFHWVHCRILAVYMSHFPRNSIHISFLVALMLIQLLLLLLQWSLFKLFYRNDSNALQAPFQLMAAKPFLFLCAVFTITLSE